MDLQKLQSEYNSGKSLRDLSKEYNIKIHLLRYRIRTRNNSESRKIYSKTHTLKHSEESKRKISESRRKFLELNPDKVPYLLNHSSKGPSYPEKYFLKIFSDLNLVKNYRIGLYELDFANISKKIDVEIDGEQHYLDSKIVESDKRRTLYLQNLGWTIIRIRWAEYKKMSPDDKRKFIEKLRGIVA